MKDIFRFFIKDYLKFGTDTYPYLFIISLILFIFDIVEFSLGCREIWIILALIMYVIFFGGTYINFIFNKINEIHNDYK
jgi:hypothetical protein